MDLSHEFAELIILTASRTLLGELLPQWLLMSGLAASVVVAAMHILSSPQIAPLQGWELPALLRSAGQVALGISLHSWLP